MIGKRYTAEQAASRFSIHRRTLSRSLKAEGTNFKSLVSEAKFELAAILLAHTSLSLAQISAALGYSEHAAFTRAFQRWSGQTPSAWRSARLRAEQP